MARFILRSAGAGRYIYDALKEKDVCLVDAVEMLNQYVPKIEKEQTETKRVATRVFELVPKDPNKRTVRIETYDL